MDRRFLKPTASYHELTLLLTVHRRGKLDVPVNPSSLPPATLEHVPLSRLIDDAVLAITDNAGGSALTLTPHGLAYLRGLLIDYHLELMELRGGSNEFFAELVRMIERAGCSRIILYGASDTAKALLDFLKDSPIETVAILDDDAAKQGTVFGGIPVVHPSRLPTLEFDSVIVTTVMFQDRILKQRAALIPPGKRLIGLFDSFLP